MSRRVRLPGADELFRATGSGGGEAAAVDLVAPRQLAVAPAAADDHGQRPEGTGAELAGARPADAGGPPAARRSGVRHTRPRNLRAGEARPSGRERHEEKITVYLSPDELIDLEQARLALRQEHGLAVDRGRIVREALAFVLADLEARGGGSTLVRRLHDA
jgi:hypothetical protein